MGIKSESLLFIAVVFFMISTSIRFYRDATFKEATGNREMHYVGLIKDCEKALPRDQKCVIVVMPQEQAVALEKSKE